MHICIDGCSNGNFTYLLSIMMLKWLACVGAEWCVKIMCNITPEWHPASQDDGAGPGGMRGVSSHGNLVIVEARPAG